jgi:hypothetical protein
LGQRENPARFGGSEKERERMRTSVVGGGWNISAITVRHGRQRGWGGGDGRRRGGRESEVGRGVALDFWRLGSFFLGWVERVV